MSSDDNDRSPTPAIDDAQTLVFGARTDAGAVRELNEDSVLARPPLFAVADGMGGHAAGEVASMLALDALSDYIETSGVSRSGLLAAIDVANRAILDRATQQPDTAGMGTTLTGIALGRVGGSLHWFIFNVGDSRVYHLAAGRLSQVTTDHSEVAEMVRLGRITPAQAARHPRRNVITRSLGSDPAPLVDLWTLPAESGEVFLACSDGLTLELSDAQIAEILLREEPSSAAETLVTAALAAGARDNVSAVVVGLPAAPQADELDASTAPRRSMPQAGD